MAVIDCVCRYDKLWSLHAFAHRISLLPAQDPFCARMEGQLLSKLYDVGANEQEGKVEQVGRGSRYKAMRTKRQST